MLVCILMQIQICKCMRLDIVYIRKHILCIRSALSIFCMLSLYILSLYFSSPPRKAKRESYWGKNTPVCSKAGWKMRTKITFCGLYVWKASWSVNGRSWSEREHWTPWGECAVTGRVVTSERVSLSHAAWGSASSVTWGFSAFCCVEQWAAASCSLSKVWKWGL